jgi:heme/copper-type cytochrome/quinol oxidase subunit 2
MNDSQQRFARSDGASVASSSWLERNKTLVMVTTVAIILMLVVVIVLVSRKSKQPVLSGGAVPAYVGGPGYDSVSQFASYY